MSARMHAMNVDCVEEKEASVVSPRRSTIPRPLENIAPLWRRREKQEVQAEDAPFEWDVFGAHVVGRVWGPCYGTCSEAM